MKADEIEAIVDQLIELKKTKERSEIDLLPEFDEFRKTQRMFYQVVLSEEMDTTIFKQMMAMKRKIEGGEDQYSVDVKFGQFMADKYLTPVVSKLPENKN